MNTFQPHAILVTGGAGFIGANFVRYLLSHNKDIKIINLDKLTYAGNLSHLQQLPNEEQHTFVQGDICDTALVKRLLEENEIDTIVHFAAESHVDRSIQQPMDFIQTNVLGTFILLQAAREYWLMQKKWGANHCRFHHISTDEVFGSLQLQDAAFTETTAYQPRSPYSASKAGSDHLVQAYYHTYGLPISMTNCSNNYGPYQHSEKFIPTVIQACLQNKAIPIYGNGKNIRDWLYVEDHCDAIWQVMTRGRVGENYNVGGHNEWENLSLAHYICQQMDSLFPERSPHEKLITSVIDRAGHDFRYAINTSKIQADLAWMPKESLASGIEKTIEFYLAFK